MKPILIIIIYCIIAEYAEAWISSHYRASRVPREGVYHSRDIRLASSSDAWAGDVVSNTEGGNIKGCRITAVGEEPVLEWTIAIDGYDNQCSPL